MTSIDPLQTRRATRADVARYAGVSSAVVSYTVNSGPRHVAPATRARVLEAIRVLGYRPNAAARTSVAGPNAAARGYAPIMVNFDGPPDDVAGGIRSLALRQVDGMLVSAQVSLPILSAIAETGIRTVLLNQFVAVDGIPAIGPDLYQGAAEAVRHLIWHGHTRIGYVGELGPGDQRQRGWRDALVAAGIPIGPMEPAGYSREGGYAAGQALLARDDRPTAIFASSDMQALGVLRALHEGEINIPDEIAVVGFDGSPESEYSWPALTTVRQPVTDMAREAIDRLLAPVESSEFTLHTTTLIVRQSCGCGMPPFAGSPLP